LIDKRYPLTPSAGATRHTGLSTLGNVLAAVGRFGGTSITADLNDGNLPDQWSTGPILAEAAYPEVLVARAVTDGRRLDLVLRPGTADHSRTKLGIHRLVPHMTYAVTGASESHITANAQGNAHIWIHLSDRTEVDIVPAAD
jgi:hypothetical protein